MLTHGDNDMRTFKFNSRDRSAVPHDRKAKRMKRARIDVVHVHDRPVYAVVAALLAYRVEKREAERRDAKLKAREKRTGKPTRSHHHGGGQPCMPTRNASS